MEHMHQSIYLLLHDMHDNLTYGMRLFPNTEMVQGKQSQGASKIYTEIDGTTVEGETALDSAVLEPNPAYLLESANLEDYANEGANVTYYTPMDGADLEGEEDRMRREEDRTDVTYYTPMDEEGEQEEDEGKLVGGRVKLNEAGERTEDGQEVPDRELSEGAAIGEGGGSNGEHDVANETAPDEDDSTYTPYI